MSQVQEDHGVCDPVAVYPPVVESTEILGYIKDTNGISYSRDIGRSSHIGGRVYYTFGDTFCKDKSGKFVGLQNNTAAIVVDRTKPLESTYLSIQEDGTVDALVPLTEAEILLTHNKDKRVTLWAFGGIVETSPGTGWTWFEKSENALGLSPRAYGVGIAKVVTDPVHRIEAFRVKIDNKDKLTLQEGMLFGPKEPRFGTSPIIDGEFIYLWGLHEDNVPEPKIHNQLLARVPKNKPWDRESYTFWNGESYVEDWEDAVPVMSDIQHGAFIKSTLFGSERPWVFVGCNRFGDSLVLLGAAAKLEGPWKLNPVCQAKGIDHPGGYMYCMYPHQWAANEQNGELFVSWSEQYPGFVVAAKIKLQMSRNKYWRELFIYQYSNNVRSFVSPGSEQAAMVTSLDDVDITSSGRFVAPGFSPPPDVKPMHLMIKGPDQFQVEEAHFLLKRAAENATAEEKEAYERQQRLEKLRKLEEKKRMTSSLGRAFKRFFQRRDEEQKRRRTV